jgi:hypothetical protein
LSRFELLYAKGEALDNDKAIYEAVAAAKTGMDSEDYETQENALKIFVSLVKNNRALDEAAKAAFVGIASSDLIVKHLAKEILRAIDAAKAAKPIPQ